MTATISFTGLALARKIGELSVEIKATEELLKKIRGQIGSLKEFKSEEFDFTLEMLAAKEAETNTKLAILQVNYTEFLNKEIKEENVRALQRQEDMTAILVIECCGKVVELLNKLSMNVAYVMRTGTADDARCIFNIKEIPLNIAYILDLCKTLPDIRFTTRDTPSSMKDFDKIKQDIIYSRESVKPHLREISDAISNTHKSLMSYLHHVKFGSFPIGRMVVDPIVDGLASMARAQTNWLSKY